MLTNDCPHANIYQDDFQGEFHCNDCGESFGQNPPQEQEGCAEDEP